LYIHFTFYAQLVSLAFVILLQDQFFDYMIQQAIKLDQKVLLDNRSKFVLVHSSSGFKHSLKGIGMFYDVWIW